MMPASGRADALDDLAQKAMQEQHIPGMAVLVTKEGRVLKREAYGQASLELHTPTSIDDRFEIGSITKAFTATLVMMLVEQKRLSLQDPAGKYLSKAPPEWRDVTIERLLNHQSGLQDYAYVPGLGLLDKWTMDDWWAKMPALALDFRPGSDAAYSNTNYVLLGSVVEQIEKRPIRELVVEQILKPLGMTHTLWSDDKLVIDLRAQGYLIRKAGIINRPPITETGFDGGLLSTVDDLALFDAGLRSGKLLNPATVSMMQTGARLPSGHRSPFGLCWWVAEIRHHPMISHSGQTAGYAANLSWFPDQHLNVIILANLSDAGVDLLARKIAGIYAPAVAIQKLPEGADPEPKFSRQLHAALCEIADGQIPSVEVLDDDYKARLATPRGKRSSQTLGIFKQASELSFLEIETSDPDRIFRYRTIADGKSFVVAFVVTAQSKIYAIATRQEETG